MIDGEGSAAESERFSTGLDRILAGEATIVAEECRDETRYGITGLLKFYSITLPKSTNPEESWTTELRVWVPFKAERGLSLPGVKITILTGHGELLISSNQAKVDAVYEEVKRQTEA